MKDKNPHLSNLQPQKCHSHTETRNFEVLYSSNIGVFWLNIAKFEVNWCYRYCFNLFSNLRKESELWQYHCRNSTKVWERKIKSRREKFLIFGNTITEIPSAHTYCPCGCSKCESAQGKPNVRKFFFLVIVAMPLPKMRGKKNNGCRNYMWGIKKKKVLRLQYFYNIFTTNHM